MLLRFLRNKKGFTMIEMMVVLIIIGVLIAGGIGLYSGYIENARVTKAKSYITTVQGQLDAYYAEHFKYPDPSSATELADAGIKVETAGTTAVLEATDPWGKNYKYTRDTTKAKYVVYTGYDKVQGTSGQYVVGKGEDGTSKQPEVSSNITP